MTQAKKSDQEDPEAIVRAAIAAVEKGEAAKAATSELSLPQRRPAELTGFVAAVATVATYFGFDHAEGLLVAGLTAAGTAPFVVSWVVDQWRSVFGAPAPRG